jgi:putative serine protease PepD
VKRLGPFLVVALVSVVATLGTVAGVRYARGSSSQAPALAVNASQPISRGTSPAAPAGTNNIPALYAAVRPTVVEVDTSGQGGRRRSQQFQGQGSGVVLDLQGHVLTNEHVVTGAQTITVTFADGSTASGKVLRSDAADDLAILTTDASQRQLHPATLGDSGTLKVGDFVAAVGNPFGLEGSLSTGVISGLERTLTGNGQPDQQGLIQTDAAVNEGSSGGGLFDMLGNLIGITSALENPDTSTFAGVGYAVPINTAKQVLQRFLGKATGTPSP